MNQFVTSSDTQRPRRAAAIAIVAGFLLVLPSCIPALRGPDPLPPLPAAFQVRTVETKENGKESDLPEAIPEDESRNENSAGDSGCLRYQEFFSDPYLLNLIGMALANNQEQKILIQDVQIAFNQILARTGAFLPFVTVGGNAGIEKASKYVLEGAGIRDDPFAPGKFLKNPHGNFDLGLNLWWQIDIWRQLRNARDAAIQRYLATNEGRNYAVTRLVAEIADNYYEVLALDTRLKLLNQIIVLQEQSLLVARARLEAARGTGLAVQRFEAEVRKNQSEKYIVAQRIVEVENRINFLVGRFPQPVERSGQDIFSVTLPRLALGVPPQMLQNRPDIRQAERNITAAGLDVLVARKMFYPRLIINGNVGWAAFNPGYLLITPEALIYNLAGELVAPLVNRRAIQSEFLTANAQQLQAIYDYQRVILNAFTEVINRMSKVENYGKSIALKRKQIQALEISVALATQLFQQARPGYDYVDVLFAQRDLLDARTVLVETKQQQLTAMVDTYQALGGGNALPNFFPDTVQKPTHWWSHWLHPKSAPATAPVVPVPAMVPAVPAPPVTVPVAPAAPVAVPVAPAPPVAAPSVP